MSLRSFFLIALCLIAVVAGQPASARQMDLKQVAGIPLPVPDVPAGTVTVRVIRGALTNNVPDQAIEFPYTTLFRSDRKSVV